MRVNHATRPDIFGQFLFPREAGLKLECFNTAKFLVNSAEPRKVCIVARKQVPKTLPSLNQVLRSFDGFPPHQSQQQIVTNELRKLAKRYRTEHPRPFYTMREAASFFGLPVSTVGKAYEQLELEGLVNRIRGSRTLLSAKAGSISKLVRGVIGLPVPLHGMVVSPYARALYIGLEERLRAFGYVADLIFYRREEQTRPGFAERLLMHKLDIVIWHNFLPKATENILRLADSGVRQILLRSADAPNSLNLPTYFLDWRKAFEELSACWGKIGIKQVYVPDPASILSKRSLEAFRSHMHQHGIEVVVVEGTAHALHARIKNTRDGLGGVAFLDQAGAEEICVYQPSIIEELLKETRVAFCRGPLRLPYFAIRGMVADFICLSAHEVAERLANDIRQNIPFNSHTPHTFHAEFCPGMNFSGLQDIL